MALSRHGIKDVGDKKPLNAAPRGKSRTIIPFGGLTFVAAGGVYGASQKRMCMCNPLLCLR